MDAIFRNELVPVNPLTLRAVPLRRETATRVLPNKLLSHLPALRSVSLQRHRSEQLGHPDEALGRDDDLAGYECQDEAQHELRANSRQQDQRRVVPVVDLDPLTPDGRVPLDGHVVVGVRGPGDDADREPRHPHGHRVRVALRREPEGGLAGVALVLGPRVVDEGEHRVALEGDALRREEAHLVRDVVHLLRGVGHGPDRHVAVVVPRRGRGGLEGGHGGAAGAAGHGRVGHVERLVRASGKGHLDGPVCTVSGVNGDVCGCAVPSGYDLVRDACAARVDPAVCGDDDGLEVGVLGEVCGWGVLFLKYVLAQIHITEYPGV